MVKFEDGEKWANMTGGDGGSRRDGETATVVVKLLREDEISTSWRKTIGERKWTQGGRDRGAGWS